MKRYRLNPKKPRQLTPAEARRLDATPIDYSDIPPLSDDLGSAEFALFKWNIPACRGLCGPILIYPGALTVVCVGA